MKVIVASMSKCGTKTLRKCFDTLGYSVADFDQQTFDDRDEWKNILLYGPKEGQFQRMYKGIDVVCDLPAAYFWEEISAAFPDAKVILTTRSDETQWVKSYCNQMARHEASWWIRLTFLLTPTGRQAREHFRRIGRFVFSCPDQGIFQTMHQPNKEILKRRYREHNSSVSSRCDKDQFLHFKLSDGWGPLCSFLNKDIPDQLFPHENKRGQLTDSIWSLPGFVEMKRELYFVFAIILAVACILVRFIFI